MNDNQINNYYVQIARYLTQFIFFRGVKNVSELVLQPDLVPIAGMMGEALKAMESEIAKLPDIDQARLSCFALGFAQGFCLAIKEVRDETPHENN